MINTSIKTSLIFFGFLILLMEGCTESSGPCDWREVETYAKVTGIEPYDENGDTLYHVKLKFEASELRKETQYLDELKDLKIDKDFLARNRISKGLRYKFTIHELISGNCNAPVITFHHPLK